MSAWEESSHWAPWFDFGPPNTQRPGRTRFVNGNFAFTRGVWNIEVPQDPGQYYWGEELNVTIRSFTWGYDLFLPAAVVAWHLDHRNEPPRRHWEHGEHVVQRRNAEAYARLDRLLSSHAAPLPGPYGFGRARTLHDYEIYAGFDFRDQARPPGRLHRSQPGPGHNPFRSRLESLHHVPRVPSKIHRFSVLSPSSSVLTWMAHFWARGSMSQGLIFGLTSSVDGTLLVCDKAATIVSVT